MFSKRITYLSLLLFFVFIVTPTVLQDIGIKIRVERSLHIESNRIEAHHTELVWNEEDAKWVIVTTRMGIIEELQYMASDKIAGVISSAYSFFNTNQPFVVFKGVFNIVVILLLLGYYFIDPNPI